MSADPNFNPDEFAPEGKKESAEKKVSRLKNELAIIAELKSIKAEIVKQTKQEMAVDKIRARLETHRQEAFICCPEDCWCWDVGEALEAYDILKHWAELGRWALESSRIDMTDVCGGDIQDKAVELGLLVEVPVTEPCCETCRCAEYDDFPQMCLRYPQKWKK